MRVRETLPPWQTCLVLGVAATCLWTGCGPSLSVPNVMVKRFDPLSLQHALVPEPGQPVCLPTELQLQQGGLMVSGMPALCVGPSCLPVAPDCARVALWCQGRDACLDHGLTAAPAAFDSLCNLAQECLSVEAEHRLLFSKLADTELLFPTLVGEEEWSLHQFLDRMDQTRPDVAMKLRAYAQQDQRLRSLLCQAFPLYVSALAAAGEQMLAGHNGAAQHIGVVLSSLPPTPQQVLARFAPVTTAYQRLVDAHRLYRLVDQLGGFEPVPRSILKAKPQVQTAETDALRRRLFQEGLLPSATPGSIDTAVLNALGQLRLMHGLEGGTPLSAQTLDLLEIPASKKRKQVAAALRAIRAAIPPWEPNFIHVQSPHAFLELYLDGNMASYHRTVLGSARWDYNESKRKKERMYRTPALNSVITQVILNPEWRVPESIATKEIGPKALQDPQFLERGNYRVVEYSNGTQLFIQNPGDGNALGRIKFYFENPYGVYLHDTPSKRFFGFRIRLFSHGCVRVQHASKLAFILLNRDQNVSEEDVRVWIKGRRPREFPLIHPIPIHITYHTAGADSSGNLYFLKDYYGMEE